MLRLLTSRIDGLGELDYPAYSESASTMVWIAVLKALARLHCFARDPHDNDSSVAKETNSTATNDQNEGAAEVEHKTQQVAEVVGELLSPITTKLFTHWVDFLTNFAVIMTQSPTVQKAYRNSFYSSSSISFTKGYYEKAWLQVGLYVFCVHLCTLFA